MKNKDKKKGKKGSAKRDTKGQFTKGCSGGPGRPKKEEQTGLDIELGDINPEELIEKVLKNAMSKADSHKDRISAAKAMMEFQKLTGKIRNEPKATISEEMIALLDSKRVDEDHDIYDSEFDIGGPEDCS